MPGWWRWIYGNLGIEYNSPNDIPREKDVKIKQVCMRQISLSKVKLNNVEKKERTPPDLEKIIVNSEFKIEYNNKTDIKKVVTPTPNNSPWFKSR